MDVINALSDLVVLTALSLFIVTLVAIPVVWLVSKMPSADDRAASAYRDMERR